MIEFLRDFLKLEAASGIVLMAAAALALAVANSPMAYEYESLLSWRLGLSMVDRDLSMPLHLWINDGLMAIFFLLVGLEIKREIVEGELSTRAKAALPVVAALGGVCLPAIIYAAFNWNTPAVHGWAVPSATDIAFSLGVLALFGNRISTPAKIFLMAVAVIDDLVAVLIIAAFYTVEIHGEALAVAAACAVLLWMFGRRSIDRALPYLVVGAVMWAAMLKSGVHATVAGVALGWLIPILPSKKRQRSLCKDMIHTLHPWVAFGIMPVFAFANAGIPLAGLTFDHLANPITSGIALGLFFGKQLGIFLAAWLLIRLGLARLPARTGWLEFYGVCMIAGIGFTMSLFIGALAFRGGETQLYVRLGVILGSAASALIGYALLSLALRRKVGGAA